VLIRDRVRLICIRPTMQGVECGLLLNPTTATRLLDTVAGGMDAAR